MRRQPPVVGTWCMPPTSTNATRTTCVHPSAACEGALTTCATCRYTFCASHMPRHTRRFECPVDVWRAFDARRRTWYDRVKANPKARPRVQVAFPEDADG